MEPEHSSLNDKYWNKLAADYVLDKINSNEGAILLEKISAEFCNFIAQFDRYDEAKTYSLSLALQRATLKAIDGEEFEEFVKKNTRNIKGAEMK